MTAAAIAFFVVMGLGSVVIARRLVGLRTAPVANHEIEVDALGVDELRALVLDLLDRTRDLGVGLSALDSDVQQLREVSYEQRLAARRAVQATARRDADLQQDVAEIERRVRQLEADEGPIAARAFGGWLRALPTSSGA